VRTWTSNATVPGSAADVLAFLTEPEAIARWAPIPFEVVALDRTRREAGGHARVAGRLAGPLGRIDVEVLHASDRRLELVADGPISLGVTYLLRPTSSGSDVDASISVRGGGLQGRLPARATESLIAVAVLRSSRFGGRRSQARSQHFKPATPEWSRTMSTANKTTDKLAGRAAIAAGALWAAEGVVQIVHSSRNSHDRIIGLAAHLNVGFALAGMILTFIALARHAHSDRASKAAPAAGAATTLLGLTCITSLLPGHDYAFFNVIASPANAAWLLGSVVIATSLRRTGRVPAWIALGLPITSATAIPGSSPEFLDKISLYTVNRLAIFIANRHSRDKTVRLVGRCTTITEPAGAHRPQRNRHPAATQRPRHRER
jgi:hypothetical protein